MKKFIPFRIVNISEDDAGLRGEWLVVYVDHVDYDNEHHQYRRLQPGEIVHFWPHLLDKVKSEQKTLAFKYETQALWAS